MADRYNPLVFIDPDTADRHYVADPRVVAPPLLGVDSFGATADGRDIPGAAITAASPTVTATGAFSAADEGKAVWVLLGAQVHRSVVLTAAGDSMTMATAPPFSGSATLVIGSDNAPAIAAAVAAAKADGQAGIQFGPGLYLTSEPLPSLSYTRDFRMVGASGGGMSYGYYTGMDTSPGTELRFMGSTGTFIDASYTRGFNLSDLAVRYAHPDYSDNFFNLDHTWGSYIQRFVIGGVWNARGATLVYDPRTIEAQFTDGMLERAAVGFDSGATGWANACTYTRVVWLGIDIAMQGTRNQTVWVSAVFEPTGGSMSADPLDDVCVLKGKLNGATFLACGWWDAVAATQAWLQPDGGSANINILGGYWEPRTAAERFIRVNSNIDGLTIHGLRSQGFLAGGPAYVIDPAGSGTITNLDYRANSHGSGSTASGLDGRTSGIAYAEDSGFRHVVPYGNASSALNLRTAATQTATLTGNASVALPSLPAGASMTLDLFLTQDGTGSRAPTWPGSVRWDGGTAPTILATAGATTHIQLTTLDGGTTWLGRKIADYAA